MNVLFYLMTLMAVTTNNSIPANSNVLATITWDGEAGDHLWSNPTNWSGDILPASNDDVVIPLMDTVILNAGTTTIVESVTLQNGAYLYIDINDTLQTIGGGLSGADGFRLEGTLDSITSVKLSGVLNVANAAGDGIDLNAYCYIHVTNEGSVTIMNSGSDGIEAGSSFLNDGTIAISGSGANGFNSSGAVPGGGAMITNNGSLTISNSVENGIRLTTNIDMVNEGDLTVIDNGGSVFISSDGKLTNNGFLLASGIIHATDFIHGVGGTISVYDPTDPLVFDQELNFSTNTLILDINGASIGQYDQVVVTNGEIDMDTITLVLQGSYIPQTGDIFTIVDNIDGAAVGNLEYFVGLPEGSILSFNGVFMYISYDGGDGNDMTLFADPNLVDADNDGSPFILDCDDNDPGRSPLLTEIPNNMVDEDCDGIAQMIDEDMDNFNSDVDCDDNDPTVYPGAPEICDNKDNNCDGDTDEGLTFTTFYLDSDNDGYGTLAVSVSNCTGVAPMGFVDNALDCNDDDNAINPLATEVCDGVDNNCDGITDEGFPMLTYYQDLDGDTYGDPNNSITTCGVPPANYVLNNQDCEDTNANVNPGVPEICDGIDNNCNGNIDEFFTLFTYFVDADGDGFGVDSTMISSCQSTLPAGYAVSGGDCMDNNNTVYPGAPELCDGLDNDCDGFVDEDLTFTTYYIDADGDGYGSMDMSILSCSPTPDIGYAISSDDCDDNDFDKNPGATEICDGIDNNCNGTADEGVPTYNYYADTDMDGYGDLAEVLETCEEIPPVGYVIDNTDCDDTDASINPVAVEIVGNMIDENCDGIAEMFTDLDLDGFFSDVDCDDNNAAVYPDAPEICDGLDNNCDGIADEGLATSTYYVDMDNDGFGDASTVFDTCWVTAPMGYATNGDDCNDVNPDVNPNATEIPNNAVDENCDGLIGIDVDEDGVDATIDCDDNNATVYPGAPEICDDLDNNCDGAIDEGLAITTYYADTDQDGFGDLDNTTESCSTTPPTGFAANSTDCDDTDASINPNGIEIPGNGIDEDCLNGDLVGLEVVNALLVKVSPNPTNGLVNIESDQFNNANVLLMDALGRVVLKEAFDGVRTLDISTYPGGVYWLQILDQEKIYQMKLVKE